MKKLMFAVAAILYGVSQVQAGGCQGPWCPPHKGAQQAYPVFQAAPWYLYWPYNSHFQTPAPLTGAYYAPPSYGGYLQSPYFPAQQYAPQAAQQAPQTPR